MGNTNRFRLFSPLRKFFVGNTVVQPATKETTLQLQTLEDRTVPAFTVVANGDLLTITSDNTASEILVLQSPTADTLTIRDVNGAKVLQGTGVTLDYTNGDDRPTVSTVGITQIKIVGATTKANDLDVQDISLSASVANVTVIGGTGDDSLGQASIIPANTAKLLIMGGDGADTLFGSNNSDTLMGGNGDNSLVGDNGDDLYVFDLTETGSNVIDGNTDEIGGIDTIKLVGAADAVLDLSLNTEQTIAGNLKLTLAGNVVIENIIGGDGNDVLTGNGENNTITGGLGVDAIDGGAGDDTINYAVGDGSDVIDGGAGVDTFNISGKADAIKLNLAAGNVDIDGTIVDFADVGKFIVGAESKTLSVNLTANADNLVITDETANDQFSLVTAGTTTVKFFHPTDLLELKLGDGDDSVDVQSLDTKLVPAKVNILGEAGEDTVTFNFNDYAKLAAGLFTFNGGDAADKITFNGKATTVTVDRTAAPPTVVIDGTTFGTPAVTSINTKVTPETVNLILAVSNAYKLTDGDAADDNISQFFNLVTNSFVNFDSPTVALNLLGSDASDDVLTIFGLDSKLTAPFSFDGKAGNDTLEIATGKATDVTVDLALASVKVDAKSYAFANTEQLITNVAATNLKVNLTDNVETIEIVDDGDNMNKFSFATETGSGFKLKFFHPTTDLIVNQAGGNDSLKLISIDTALVPTNIVFDGAAGTDNFELGGTATDVALDLSTGKATVDGASVKVTNYENIVLGAAAKTLSVTLTDANELVEVDDDGIANNQFSIITETVSKATVKFFHPTDLLKVDLGAGNDSFVVNSLDTKLIPAKVQILGNAGNDQISGTPIADLLDGGAGDDSLEGLDGNDTLLGGDGLDSFVGGAGDDSLEGGAGVDTFEFNTDGAQGNDTINDADNTVLDFSGAQDKASGVLIDLNNTAMQKLSNNLSLMLTGGAKVDMLMGTAGNDTIVGTPGADTIMGMGGDDILLGGDGNDNIDGGDGNDGIDGGAGNDNINGGAGNDLIFGGTGLDNVLAGDGNDSVGGGDGNDTLNGGLGNDLLFGEAGNDNLVGSDGADGINGGIGDDTIDGGIGADLLFGDDGNDSILGGDGNDSIGGGNGTDFIDGGLGNDLIFGEAGVDTLVGGDGNDTVGGGADNDSITGGVGDDSLEGEAGNDTVLGNAGRDTVHGGAGTNSVGSQDTFETDNYLIG